MFQGKKTYIVSAAGVIAAFAALWLKRQGYDIGADELAPVVILLLSGAAATIRSGIKSDGKGPGGISLAFLLVLFPGFLDAQAPTTCDNTGASHTLYLPYAEVDLTDAGGRTTLFALRNASEEPALVRFDWYTLEGIWAAGHTAAVPAHGVYTINLRDPLTDGLPVCSGAGLEYTPEALREALGAEDVAHFWIMARGVQRCEVLPDDVALSQTPLTGDVFVVDPGDNFADGYSAPREPLPSLQRVIRFSRAVGPFDGTDLLFLAPAGGDILVSARDEGGDPVTLDFRGLSGPSDRIAVGDELSPGADFGSLTIECRSPDGKSCPLWASATWFAEGRYNAGMTGDCHVPPPRNPFDR